jgi:pimeloyl-ACP methyl ester carboxylesterase
MTGEPITVTANGYTFTGLGWGPAAGPSVLLLHGFPQRCTSWAGVAARLAAIGVHTVAIDQRGYSPGARPVGTSAYAMPHLIADVVGVIEALGAPVHLAGHDWGGVVGWQVAARRPDLVRSWTAVSTPYQLALDELLAAEPAERERFAYIRRFREVGAAETALLAEDGAGLAAVYGGAVPPERVAEDVAFLRQPGALTAALAWYRAMSREDSAGLGPVVVPTAYVWGSADPAFGRAAAERTGSFVHAPYRFVPLEGASHWLPDQVPDILAEVIAAQVQEQPG